MSFPTTHWGLLGTVRKGPKPDQEEALNRLMNQYWRPVYNFVRYNGFQSEEAKDLTQDFFEKWFIKDLFARADPGKGRFRSFLLKSLKNFLYNQARASHAKKRRPEGGFVSINDLEEDFSFLVGDDRTPEAIFNQAWAVEFVIRILKELENRCTTPSKKVRYEILRRRVIAPALEGAEPPTLKDLGNEFGLTEREVSNSLGTAKRAYRRLLTEEIEVYAVSEEEVQSEIHDLFQFLSLDYA